MISPEAHAAILRKVAARAVSEARAAWKEADKAPTRTSVRDAYQACVLASRMLRKAAAVTPDEAGTMLAEAIKIDVTGGMLKDQLVRLLETRERSRPKSRR